MSRFEYLDIRQLSEATGIPQSTIYDLVHKRKIASYRFGRRLLFKLDEIAEAIDQTRRKSNAETEKKGDGTMKKNETVIERPKKFSRPEMKGVYIEGLMPSDPNDREHIEREALASEVSNKDKVDAGAFSRLEKYLIDSLSRSAKWTPLALLRVIHFPNGQTSFVVAIQYEPTDLMGNHWAVEKTGLWSNLLLNFERRAG